MSVRAINQNYQAPRFKEVIKKLPDDDSFQIGQIYDDRPVTTLSCAKCGSDEFMVGQGSYFTAIRCPSCKWELCIHDG